MCWLTLKWSARKEDATATIAKLDAKDATTLQKFDQITDQDTPRATP